MVSARSRSWIGSGLLVVGALVVGEAIHVSVVQGTYAVTAPPVVVRLAIGIAAIAVGYRLDVHPREYYSSASPLNRENEQTETESAGPGEASPLDDEALERLEDRERERERDQEGE